VCDKIISENSRTYGVPLDTVGAVPSKVGIMVPHNTDYVCDTRKCIIPHKAFVYKW